VVELTNGCICCTVADEFLPAMEKLLARSPAPDHIVIETSGLALPQPLVRALAWPDVRHRVTVDGVVTVVDAPAVAEGRFAPQAAPADPAREHDDPVEELFEDQLRCADLVVVSKTDLVDVPTLSAVEAKVAREARPGTATLRSAGEGLPANVLLGLASASEDDMKGRESHHDLEGEEHDHDDFDSFVVPVPAFASLDALKAAVTSALAVPGVLRIKGRARVAGKASPVVVQAVGPRLETWYAADGAGEGLVVIGLRDMDRAAVSARLAA
jgi:cobalamin biosynthesis protein CobW